MKRPRETDLYAPIKAWLTARGYEVKAEIGAVDVMACRPGDDPVLVELKSAFSLSLVHQGIARQAVTDWVYLAVPRRSGRVQARARADTIALCRRLGLGFITVRLRDGFVEVHADPAPYRPRKSASRKGRLLREFERRAGDPNTGGAVRAAGLVTAYRQDALRCARHLAEGGAVKGAIVARATGVANATRIMSDDHYGWFRRVATGIYELTPKGRAALPLFDAAGAVIPAAQAYSPPDPAD